MKWFNLSDNVNLLSLIGAVVTVVLTLVVVQRIFKNIKNDKQEGTLSDDNWDNIGEYTNPIPVGWAVMFILTSCWAIWYMLFGYPLNAYNQIGAYNEEVAAYNEQFEEQWKNPSHEMLIGMGEGVFLVSCAPCHGITADGLNGQAANLQKWGSEEALVDNIMNGSKGLSYPLGEMPAKLVDLSDATAIAAYVAKEISAIKSTKNPNLVEKGKALFVTCAACHGQDGKGLNGMAPNLTQYGSADFVVDVLNRGKNGSIGNMPKFDHGLLTDIQKRAVGTYIRSLTNPE